MLSDMRRDDPSLLLVLKWGGELTPAGRVQAEELGRAFRCMYPGGQGTATPAASVSSASLNFISLVFLGVSEELHYQGFLGCSCMFVKERKVCLSSRPGPSASFTADQTSGLEPGELAWQFADILLIVP